MKRRITKSLSAVLAVVMLSGLLVVPALAEELTAEDPVAVQEEDIVADETLLTDEVDAAIDDVIPDSEDLVTEETVSEAVSEEASEQADETVGTEATLAETIAVFPEAEATVSLHDVKTGWYTKSSKTYYFFDDGTKATYTKKIDGKYYRFNKKGVQQTGWQTISGKTYYFDPAADGAAVTGLKKLNGKKYFFNSKGVMVTGWKTINDKRYYFDSKGVMATGWKTIDGSKYYFKDNGVRAAKWQKIGKKYYYFNPKNGKMFTGGHTIKNVFYHFTSKGACLDYNSECPVSVDMTKKAQNYSSPTRYLILVDCGKNRLGLYEGYKGHWKQKYFWPVSTGAGGSPTVKGTYSINGNRGYAFGTDSYTCYWYSSFYGGYLMHSIKYKAGTMTVKDGRLGRSISGGCVRMSIENAKWIYDNVPIPTTVVTYKN